MKVALGTKLQNGPWGGGNQFARCLAEYLHATGFTVVFDLADHDIDLIVLTDPRKNLQSCAFDDEDIMTYLRLSNPRALVIHRINECDERKGTRGLNARLRRANRIADHSVFVSEWLRSLHTADSWPCPSTSVIRNGSDTRVFHARWHQPWDGQGKLGIVTHHWGANWHKGFDIYRQLDEMLGDSEFQRKYAFTYVGNLPSGFAFRNASYLLPCQGEALADILRAQHLYLTASLYEPGGHHQNEGANCGLPLLFRESGSMPEYCAGFGLGFTPENFPQKLEAMRFSYQEWQGKMSSFPHSAEAMCRSYVQLFIELLARREELLARRRPLRSLNIWLRDLSVVGKRLWGRAKS